MKISFERQVLNDTIAHALSCTSSKTTNAILECLLINADSEFSITGYDLKVAARNIANADDVDIIEKGSIAINAKLFSEILRKLPNGIVTISVDDSLNVNIKCGKTKFNFMGMSAESYPDLPEVNPVNSIELPQDMLSNMIMNTKFATADNDIRPVYTGTLFEIKDNTLTLVSVDGYRLAKRVQYLENSNIEDCSFIVPKQALNEIFRTGLMKNISTRISVGAKHISFQVGNTTIISRRLEGDFLDYRKAIPAEFKHIVSVDCREFIETLETVNLINKEKTNNPVRMIFNDGNIHCMCNTAIGKAESTCICNGDGAEIEIGFNADYIIEAAKFSVYDEINLCFSSPTSPMVITDKDSSDKFANMVLPVRLNPNR